MKNGPRKPMGVQIKVTEHTPIVGYVMQLLFYEILFKNAWLGRERFSSLRRPVWGQIFSNIHENHSWDMIFNGTKFN
jgi:hypothetical protein